VDGSPAAGVAVGAIRPVAMDPEAVGGAITFDECIVRNTDGFGAMVFSKGEGVSVSITNTHFERTARNLTFVEACTPADRSRGLCTHDRDRQMTPLFVGESL
jgi:hypothetical protein